MLILHIANKNYSSWSLRPWVLLSELAIPFEERLTPFGGAPFQSFSPTGKVPCLVDGEVVVWESLAIAEYLAERHAGVWPADAAARAWARSAAAEMHAGFFALRNACPMSCGLRVRPHAFAPALEADLTRLDALWREGLARFGGPFLAGPAFTAADAFFAPVAFRIQTYGLPLGEAAAAYASRLLALPSMQRWQAAALAETWRDPAHEDETRQAGVLLEDRRAPAA
ncbi:glutathione S-transferase [Frateuria defendens]|uniref:glutathione S-transferase n=1 Tax=Frateuria defendens TaxID=2219559 RepID=UPI00066FBB62|nr:glutathione S-transferase [Frateuria defendens]